MLSFRKKIQLFSILFILLPSLYVIWNVQKQNQWVVGEIRYHEIIAEELNDNVRTLIDDVWQNEKGLYLATEKGNDASKPQAAFIYSNMQQGKNHYSYPKADIKRTYDTLQIYIVDQPAFHDNEVKNELLLFVETFPTPQKYEVYYNGKLTQTGAQTVELEDSLRKPK